MKAALWNPGSLLPPGKDSSQPGEASRRAGEDRVCAVGSLSATFAPSKLFQSLASKKALKKKKLSSYKAVLSTVSTWYPKALRREAGDWCCQCFFSLRNI